VSHASNEIPSVLDGPARAGIAEAVELARSSGQTRWIARVLETEEVDPLACYARAGTQDRFFWERAETGESLAAWGCVDEAESAGPGRFEDIRGWAESVRGRLHWVGAPRPSTAPLFVGGFGFEDDGSPSEDWKAFPASRFFMPAILAERWKRESLCVLFVRIEPGVSTESIESALASRLEEALASLRGGDRLEALGANHAASERASVVSTEAAGGWSAGPEYRVQSDRAHSVYRAQVRRALDEIEAGRLQKVVVARSLRVDHDGPLEVPPFLERLRVIYPSCTLVAFGRGQDTFLAATPETLVRLEGTCVRTAALAGSAPRGRTPEEDRLLGDALLASRKDRAEHGHVVEAIRDVLGPLCEAIEVPASPRLRALFGIQHLETPIRGVLRSAPDDIALRPRAPDVLDLVAALHPTPAVGGVPGPRAREWLRRCEALDRGWYAAPIGWLDASGGGDFRVALRSALVRNGLDGAGVSGASRARLFAGAGIVAGSQPEQELVETRIKLRALLAPLTEI
jgi:isochorismate synthase